MEILENRAQWEAAFRAGWLAEYRQSGTMNWKAYNRPRNTVAPHGGAVNLSEARLLLISSAGGYLRASQEPFDAANDLGDYTIRIFSASTPLDQIAYAHDHYDHAAVNADPQVLLPLRHLEDLVAEGVVGEIAPSVVSFMGYQPDVARILDELIPAILEVARAEQPHAALLVPS